MEGKVRGECRGEEADRMKKEGWKSKGGRKGSKQRGGTDERWR